MFREEIGNRPGVQDFILLISSGVSNNQSLTLVRRDATHCINVVTSASLICRAKKRKKNKSVK